VGTIMRERFGLPHWQFTLSATDANRFVVRLARQITGRPKIMVHNHCYHGSVDETVCMLDPDTGAVVPRVGAVGPPVDPAVTTRVVKECVNRAQETTLAEGLLFERRMFHAMFSTEDQKEGMAAFLEKRQPQFRDR
ncbi:MAG: enoyl-CoA hydratase-related protein, partial [Pseudomonadota bacterium]